jgi:hypothetical protein
MIFHGDILKMRSVHNSPVEYFLQMNEKEIEMNSLLKNKIRIEFTGIIHCIACGKTTKKSFGQGFCYPCFINSPLNSECILRPELCEAHSGKGRDPSWEEEHHNKPHVVYLAQTSTVKVGVTREEQVPIRWIDQGAWKAVKIAETPYRKLAGEIEVNLKNYYTDKTSWQKMLKNEMLTETDILKEKNKIRGLIEPEYQKFLITGDEAIYEFQYPVLEYPKKINSLSLDKNPVIESVLTGIRGQYLIFNNTDVINIRNFSGYGISLEINGV